MAHYYTYADDNYGNRFQYRLNEFSQMRNFIITTRATTEMCFLGTLLDILDAVREMKEGDKVYVISSSWRTHCHGSIESFNRMVETLCKEHPDMADHYRPRSTTAFSIKRTAKRWIVTLLRDEVIFA